MRPTLRIKRIALAALLGVSLSMQGVAQELLTQPGASSLVDLCLQFRTGAAYDPKGGEGSAALVAAMLSEGSTTKRSYDELLELFYPWAVQVGSVVDKEVVSFAVTVHQDHLEEFSELFVEMMSQPKFDPNDFVRLRDKAQNFLTQDLRSHNDEELGKETLYLELYPAGHPYGHHNVGSLLGLANLDLKKLETFYRQQFTASNFTLGVAGGYPEGFPEELRDRLVSALPKGGEQVDELKIARAAKPDGRRVTIVEKDTRSVAMSLGFPIEVNRSHPDWTALDLVRSFLGEHRSSNSYLYQRLREARGLNYGDYAYIEYFPNGMYAMQPLPYYPRTEQIFQIWVRPVQPETAVFTLRAVLFELEKLLENGLTQEQFEATRNFLSKNAPLQVASSSQRLGYAMLSRFYGVDPYVEKMRRELASLTLEQVNDALRRHLQAEDIEIVLVSKDAEQLRQALREGAPSPISYNSPKPEEILREDKVIANFPLNLGEVLVVPVGQMFR